MIQPALTDLEATRLCAEAMLIDPARIVSNFPGRYDPLHDDEQAMALVKKFKMALGYSDGWSAKITEPAYCQTFHYPDLNAAIVYCIASMMEQIERILPVLRRKEMSVERCAICGEAKSGHVPGGCACEIPMNLHSTQHEHEPQIPPTYDEEGRCLICVMLVEIRDIKTIAFHLGEDKKELQSKLSSALDAGKEGWNQFYALRKQIAEEKHPGMTQEVKANE